MNLRSGSYIDQIGFTTNENIQLGPIGGPGGSPSNLKVPNNISNVKQVYLHGIQGVTLGYDIFGRQVGTLCIAKLKFIFAVIPSCDDESQTNNIHESVKAIHESVKDIRSIFNSDSEDDYDYASDNDSDDD